MEDDLVERRTRETSFGAQCTDHSANSMSKSQTYLLSIFTCSAIATFSGQPYLGLHSDFQGLLFTLAHVADIDS